MTSIKKIQEEIEAQRSMRGLIEVYEEMAAQTMKEIREAILSSREYYHGLAQLSAEVGADVSSLQKVQTKRRALVLLSPDSGMYGEITETVFASFLAALRAKTPDTDVYVIGRVGTELLKSLAPETRFTTLTIGKATTENDVFAEVVKKLVAYVQVEIFFGQFQSIVRQAPTSRILSAGELELTKKEWAGEVEMRLKYLYEPNLEKIAATFGQQIFSGIIEQTVKEDELSKNASRLMHLDQAWTHVDESLANNRDKLRRAHKRPAGKKQGVQLSGYIGRRRGRSQVWQ